MHDLPGYLWNGGACASIGVCHLVGNFCLNWWLFEMEKNTCPCCRKELFSAHIHDYEPIDDEIENDEHDEKEADNDNVWPDQQYGDVLQVSEEASS